MFSFLQRQLHSKGLNHFLQSNYFLTSFCLLCLCFRDYFAVFCNLHSKTIYLFFKFDYLILILFQFSFLLLNFTFAFSKYLRDLTQTHLQLLKNLCFFCYLIFKTLYLFFHSFFFPQEIVFYLHHFSLLREVLSCLNATQISNFILKLSVFCLNCLQLLLQNLDSLL